MSTRRFVSAVTLVVLSAFASSTSADSAVEKTFEILKAQRAEGDGYLMSFLYGAGHAAFTINAKLSSDGRAPLYCQPPKLALYPSNYADIALRAFEKRPSQYQHAMAEKHPNESLVDALLDGLMATFPCE